MGKAAIIFVLAHIDLFWILLAKFRFVSINMVKLFHLIVSVLAVVFVLANFRIRLDVRALIKRVFKMSWSSPVEFVMIIETVFQTMLIILI